MICPYCSKMIKGIGMALRNLESYSPNNGSVIVVTDCCKNPVTVKSTLQFSVSKYEGQRTEDDWGNQITRSKI